MATIHHNQNVSEIDQIETDTKHDVVLHHDDMVAEDDVLNKG